MFTITLVEQYHYLVEAIKNFLDDHNIKTKGAKVAPKLFNSYEAKKKFLNSCIMNLLMNGGGGGGVEHFSLRLFMAFRIQSGFCLKFLSSVVV